MIEKEGKKTNKQQQKKKHSLLQMLRFAMWIGLAVDEWLIFRLQAQAVQQMVYLFWCTVYVMFYADW